MSPKIKPSKLESNLNHVISRAKDSVTLQYNVNRTMVNNTISPLMVRKKPSRNFDLKLDDEIKYSRLRKESN